MKYPVKLKKEAEGAYTATFPDIPEAITYGATVEETLLHAKDALESAMDFYFDAREAIPSPSPAKRGQYLVELTPSVAAKVLLLNEMIVQKVRPSELARRLQVSPQEVHRLTDLKYGSKIDGIAAALQVLGKSLELRAV